MRCCGDKRVIAINRNKEKIMKVTRVVVRFGLFASIFSLLSFSAIAQEVKLKKKQVPRAVISAFDSAYPRALFAVLAGKRRMARSTMKWRA